MQRGQAFLYQSRALLLHEMKQEGAVLSGSTCGTACLYNKCARSDSGQTSLACLKIPRLLQQHYSLQAANYKQTRPCMGPDGLRCVEAQGQRTTHNTLRTEPSSFNIRTCWHQHLTP